jgi:uncharacterized damage-inducible protein DinB
MEISTEYFQSLARYNKWTNARLYQACESLPDNEYFEKRKSFFNSIHGTLNHILIADRIWLSRIEGTETPHRDLDEQPYDSLEELKRYRMEEDDRIINLVETFTTERIGSDIEYVRISEPLKKICTPLWQVLAHFFNHQTHHRGQAHDQLNQTDVAPPPLDLLFFFREHTPLEGR